jgi:hypothetical protein
MSESHAEQLDASVLGEDDTDDIGDDTAPAADFPPEDPLGVDDPSILADGSIADDDYATREERHRHDDEPDDGDGSDDTDDGTEAPALIDPSSDPDVLDDERQMLADEGDRDTSPEASAVHVIAEPD